MAAETEITRVTDKDRTTCRIDTEIMRKVRIIAANENLGVSEAIERDLRKSVERRYAKLATDLGGEG